MILTTIGLVIHVVFLTLRVWRLSDRVEKLEQKERRMGQ